MIGEVIGSYRVVAELGRGGMGMVYHAEHVQLGRAAAIKMLQPQFSNDTGIVQRFFNEARAASAIDHPGIVEIYDFGTHYDGRAYIVMALLKGESLEHRLGRAPIGPREGATIVAQVAGALAAAHARGIVHRDLKPDNIFLVPNELMPDGIQVKLLDFGIAKLADERAAGFKTQTGALIGTPAYMSPEQCMGRPDLDHRTDLYSVGCILFHVLCGRPPFTSTQGTGVMIAAHLRDPPPDPRSLVPDISPELAAIVLRLLEKDPAARFQSASELRGALVAAGATAYVTEVPATTGHASAVGAPVRYTGPEAYGATNAPTTSSGSAAQVVGHARQRGPNRLGVWIVVGGLLAALAAVAIVVAVSRPDPQPESIARPTPAPRTAIPDAAIAVERTAPPPPTSTPQPTAKTRPMFALSAASYAPRDVIEIRFAAPISSPSSRRAWITIVQAGTPPAGYDEWKFVEDRATAANLRAPVKPGDYEVRLHTDYPTRAFNVQYAVAFAVAAGAPNQSGGTPRAQQRFTLASTTVRMGGRADIAFAAPLYAARGERFWITVVKTGAADTAWGYYEYVPEGARTMQLAVPRAVGDYEVRLHANYPTKTTNLVHRVPIRVVDQ